MKYVEYPPYKGLVMCEKRGEFSDTCSIGNFQNEEQALKPVEYEYGVILKNSENNPYIVSLYSKLFGYNDCDKGLELGTDVSSCYIYKLVFN